MTRISRDIPLWYLGNTSLSVRDIHLQLSTFISAHSGHFVSLHTAASLASGGSADWSRTPYAVRAKVWYRVQAELIKLYRRRHQITTTTPVETDSSPDSYLILTPQPSLSKQGNVLLLFIVDTKKVITFDGILALQSFCFFQRFHSVASPARASSRI